MSSRDDILSVATRLFADQGYEGTGVREICAAANANVAAINYHFGGKGALYHEVVKRAYEASRAISMPSLSDHSGAAEDALAAWISWYVDPGPDVGNDPARRLLLKEAANPTAELNDVVRSVLHPVYCGLEEIVIALLPAKVDPRTLKIHCLSILGQCLIHRVCREMIDRLPVTPPLGPEDAGAISSVVTANSLAALSAARRTSTSESTP